MEGVSQLPQGLQPQAGQSNADEEARREAEEAIRRDMMATVLDTAARERRKYLFTSSQSEPHDARWTLVGSPPLVVRLHRHKRRLNGPR